MKKQVKWALWGIAAGLLAIFAIYSATRPLTAELVEVAPRAVEKKFTETGTVAAQWQRTMNSTVPGKVLSVHVREGDAVKAGQVLVTLDTTEISYQIAQLRGQLTSLSGQQRQAFSGPRDAQIAQQQLAVEQAKSQQDAIRAEYERAEALYQAGAVSRSTYEEAQRAVTQTELLLSQQQEALKLLTDQSQPPPGTSEQFTGQQASIRAQIALLEYQKEQAIITAPADGTIAVMHIDEGDISAPGMPILFMFQPGAYELEVFLLAEDVSGISPGMEVRAIYRGLDGDVPYTGTIAKIAPTAVERVSTLGLVEQRVKVTIRLTSDTSALRPGYALDVEFITHREENKLALPKIMIFPYQGQSAVWVVRDGRAEIQPIEKGLETDDEAVITTGLSQGDLVIRNPSLDGLQEGSRVVAQ